MNNVKSVIKMVMNLWTQRLMCTQIMWPHAQVWMDAAQLLGTLWLMAETDLEKSFIICTWIRNVTACMSDCSNTHAYARLMHNYTLTITYLRNLWSVNIRKSQSYILTRHQKWGNELSISGRETNQLKLSYLFFPYLFCSLDVSGGVNGL